MPRPNSERIQLSLGVTPQERPGPHVSYTMELIELINWQPNPTKGPKGEAILTDWLGGGGLGECQNQVGGYRGLKMLV